MAHRNSKDAINFRIDMDPEVLTMLENFCAKAGRTRKAVVQSAIVEHVSQPVRPFPALLEEIAKRKKLGRATLEGDPAKLSRRPAAKTKKARSK